MIIAITENLPRYIKTKYNRANAKIYMNECVYTECTYNICVLLYLTVFISKYEIYFYIYLNIVCVLYCCVVVNRRPKHLMGKQGKEAHWRALPVTGRHTLGRKKVSTARIKEMILSSGNHLIIFHHCPQRTWLSVWLSYPKRLCHLLHYWCVDTG